MRYLGETEKTDSEVEQWNTRFLKEKPTRYEDEFHFKMRMIWS